MAMKKIEDEISCSHCASDIFEKKEPTWDRKKILQLTVSFIILLFALYFEFILGEIDYSFILYFIVVIVAGHEILMRAGHSILDKRLDMNFLMAIAAVGAFVTKHAEEGASVVFLFSIAEFLEDYATARAERAINSLLSLSPDTATVRRDGKEIQLHTHEIKLKEIVIVKPGEKIPVDGIIYTGKSTVNQAAITGESRPVTKKIGEEVYAGTINEAGYLEVKVIKKSNETVIAKIAKLVENAEKQKSKTEKFVDKFTAHYTPIIIILAICYAILPPLLFHEPFGNWIYKALILLVVACPCALAISTPVSLVSALTCAAKNGLLIKGGEYIEGAAQTKAIILDKTGTLTKGIFEVSDILVGRKGRKNKENEKYLDQKNEILKIAASLERVSAHPIAKAIVQKFSEIQDTESNTKYHKVEKFISLSGKGISGTVKGIKYFLGNSKMPMKIDSESEKAIEQLESNGKTVAILGTKEKVIGIFGISDTLRFESSFLLNELEKLHITPIMLTGDNEETAKAIASQLKIDHYHASLLPHEKLEEVEALRKEYGNIMVVGDGVNDAPSLAAANVGVAMGAIGSAVAIETADIAVMKDDLSKIPFLIHLSKKTMRIVKQNITVSIVVKGSIAILAFFGLISLWTAVGIGDLGLSLVVILNALRIGNAR